MWGRPERSGGNPAVSPGWRSWYTRSARAKPSNSHVPTSTSSVSAGAESTTSSRVAADTSTCPPWAASRRRATRLTVTPK